jgi:hypothetical protein
MRSPRARERPCHHAAPLQTEQGGNAGQDEFEGEWIHFKTEKFPNWETVVDYLMSN